MDIVKISALCIIAALLVVFLKQYKGEYGFLAALAAAVIIITFLFSQLVPILNEIYALAQKGNAVNYYKIALKALGIAYITAFAANSCRDFGQSALAAKAELAGRLALCALSLPLLSGVLELALTFADV
ncbi:MAG: stage III sporulation protein AD [Ruminococcaceae bacterium]|nr:stage III sporulation protein AD [Oscillospiraceae bacterium]